MTDGETKIQEAFYVLSKETKGLLFISIKQCLLTSSDNVAQCSAWFTISVFTEIEKCSYKIICEKRREILL